MTISLTDINFLAVFVGGILYMLFGALYFSPILFGNIWSKLNDFNMEENRAPKIIGPIVVAFISSYLVAVIAHSMGTKGFGSGILLGLVLGLLLSLAYLKNAIFGLMNKKVYGIAVIDHVISFMILSVLHSLWR